MSNYLWGLATLPIGLAAAYLLLLIARLGYLLLGRVGKVGVARYGRPDDDYRFRAGAVFASAGRVLLFNKGTTGLALFTGLHHDLNWGGIGVYEAALRKADHEIRRDYLPASRDDEVER